MPSETCDHLHATGPAGDLRCYHCGAALDASWGTPKNYKTMTPAMYAAECAARGVDEAGTAVVFVPETISRDIERYTDEAKSEMERMLLDSAMLASFPGDIFARKAARQMGGLSTDLFPISGERFAPLSDPKAVHELNGPQHYSEPFPISAMKRWEDNNRN